MTKRADALVIGGGIAGLQATRELSAAGFEVTLLEARNRLGGRVYTIRCDSYPVELGAEFVHGRPAEIFRLASETGLQIAPVEGEFISKDQGRWRSGDETWSEVNQLFARLPYGEPDQPFQKYIEGAEASEEAKRHALGFVEGFHAADPERVSVHWLARTIKAEEEIDGERSFRLVDGYASLVRALAGRIDASRCRIHLQTAVTELRWKPGQVTVRTSAGEFSAARAIVTVPISVLKLGEIRFLPELAEKDAAMQRLEMGPAIRVSLCFRKKFWETRRELKNASFLFTNDTDFPTWWTSKPLPYPILTGWAAGRRANALTHRSEAWIVERAAESLARILEVGAEELRETMESGFVHDWQADPFSRGAYSYAAAGGADAARILAARVAQTLYFAGEATDFEGNNGTVHGAMASGSRAAQEAARDAGGQLSRTGPVP